MAILVKFSTCFLNEFAAKRCEFFTMWIFLPHRNNVSTLSYETWNAHCALSHLNCGLQIRQIWIQLITACGKYARKVYKHASLMRSYRRRLWRMVLPQGRHDPAWPIPFPIAVSVRPDKWCVFCTPFLSIVLTRCNQSIQRSSATAKSTATCSHTCPTSCRAFPFYLS